MGGKADVPLIEFEVEREFTVHGLEGGTGRRRDLGADPIAGKDENTDGSCSLC